MTEPTEEKDSIHSDMECKGNWGHPELKAPWLQMMASEQRKKGFGHGGPPTLRWTASSEDTG